MDKKTKKKVLLGVGIAGAVIGVYILLKRGGFASRVKIYGAFNSFKKTLPKGIISTYGLQVNPRFPIKNTHIVAY